MVSYPRYLASKKSLDDVSLNSHVFSCLRTIAPSDLELRVIELGSGIGTMITRMIDWELIHRGRYTAIDMDRTNLNHSSTYLERWSSERGFRMIAEGNSIRILGCDKDIDIELLEDDVIAYKEAGHQGEFDLLLAHLFLDMIDVSKHLHGLLRMLKSGGLFYFTHMFDGLTVILPQEDPEFDRRILGMYHSTMDGEGGYDYRRSETGRKVLEMLIGLGWVDILAAGSSDWVVLPSSAGYSEDDSDFLHFILDMIHEALHDKASGGFRGLEQWIEARKENLKNGQLGLIVHQLDVAGRVV